MFLRVMMLQLLEYVIWGMVPFFHGQKIEVVQYGMWTEETDYIHIRNLFEEEALHKYFESSAGRFFLETGMFVIVSKVKTDFVQLYFGNQKYRL